MLFEEVIPVPCEELPLEPPSPPPSFEDEAVKRRLEQMLSLDYVKMFLKTIRQYDSLQLLHEGQDLPLPALSPSPPPSSKELMPGSDGVISSLPYEVEAVKRRLERMLHEDDVKMFLKTIREYNSLQLCHEGQDLLITACESKAIKCATAILSGETSLIFDVNKTKNDCKAFPIHYVAHSCCPGMIELLLYHGASADVECEFYLKEPIRKCFPLFCAVAGVRILCLELDKYRWTRGDSVFKLVFLICLQKFQETLECVELLACKTSNFQDEFLRYAREGELDFLASLLAVARRKLTLSIGEIRELLSSSSSEAGIAEGKEAAIFLLFDVFEKAGEGLEACIKKNKNGVTVRETSSEVARLLIEAGFSKNDVETDLRCFLWTDDDYFTLRESSLLRSADMDVGMEHYGTSGCRWGTYNVVQSPILRDCNLQVDQGSRSKAAKKKKVKGGKVVHRSRTRWVFRG